MIIATWNIGGLNQAHKQKEVKTLIAANKVDIMACRETRVKEQKAKKIQKKIANGWSVCCNYSCAVNGRIWLLWRNPIQVIISHMTDQFIHCKVEDHRTQFKAQLSIIYAQNDGHKREKDRIGSPVTAAEVEGFKGMIDDMQLTPLRAKGWHYTWTNKQGTGSRVYSKIDRALGNYQWIQQYGHVEADYMNPSVSDHSPILIKCGSQKLLHPKPFRLYTNVMDHPQFHNIVQQTWQKKYEGIPMQKIWYKLKSLKEQLKVINTYMASYRQKLDQARERLDIVQNQMKQNPLAQSLINEEKEVISEIEKWSKVEEQVLRQKSKASWIECGDDNTKYFHAQWKIRASQNNITTIYT
ncbi:PREDICTED: uncharacterized protein LOC109240882 [Nicotiana attenuata]|uniref:uncharacterized protein LOC109240882 n=1 Tax=Nicotiana attenuata TaxID=49451 RepID=UPI0009049083|nr:PREDICTED: uncharacterized protein LOC109240882 [Nicotiana attenuata]